MIINDYIRNLILKIEQENKIENYLKELINALKINCQNNSNIPLYKSFEKNIKYPIENGFAKSFDPLYQEKELLEHWHNYGFVVGKNVVSFEQCNDVINTMHNIMDILNMHLEDLESYYVDSAGVPILSRGFFELYHDNVLAQIRQNLRLYIYHVILWGSPFLWTSFDRLGMKTPVGENCKALPLHIDQNPVVHPGFTTIQGVLALEDCPIEKGTFVAVPNSKYYFKQYINFIKEDYKGEYIELPQNTELSKKLESQKQAIPIKKGEIVSWDSRVTHGNSNNFSQSNRYVMYLSTGIAKRDQNLINLRKDYFLSGVGYNVREAYLHASKKPRFTNIELLQSLRQKESLTTLGNLLYGLERYEDVL